VVQGQSFLSEYYSVSCQYSLTNTPCSLFHLPRLYNIGNWASDNVVNQPLRFTSYRHWNTYYHLYLRQFALYGQKDGIQRVSNTRRIISPMLVHDEINLEPYVNEILEVLFEDSSYKVRVRRTLLKTTPSLAAAHSVRMLWAGVDVRIKSSVSRYSRSPHMNLCDFFFSGVDAWNTKLTKTTHALWRFTNWNATVILEIKTAQVMRDTEFVMSMGNVHRCWQEITFTSCCGMR